MLKYNIKFKGKYFSSIEVCDSLTDFEDSVYGSDDDLQWLGSGSAAKVLL